MNSAQKNPQNNLVLRIIDLIQFPKLNFVNQSFKHAELTHAIIGSAMEVHNHPGSGFQEVIYQRALSIELKLRGIEQLREQEMEVNYKGHHVGERRVDFFCGRKGNGGTKSHIST